jgi:serine/threonine protein phosphatase PrpC
VSSKVTFGVRWASEFTVCPYNSTGMEDAHATILSLDEKVGDEKASFFAVYDGHGGG